MNNAVNGGRLDSWVRDIFQDFDICASEEQANDLKSTLALFGLSVVHDSRLQEECFNTPKM